MLATWTNIWLCVLLTSNTSAQPTEMEGVERGEKGSALTCPRVAEVANRFRLLRIAVDQMQVLEGGTGSSR